MLPLKDLFVKHENRIVLFIGVILLSIMSYGIGRLGTPQPKEPITIEANSQKSLPVDKPILKSSISEENKQTQNQEKSLQDNGTRDNITTPITGNNNKNRSSATTEEKKVPVSKRRYVASKNGTKYHLPTCSGAKRIKEENKIWFDSKTEAEQAGYEPAKNCKGI